MQMQFATPKSLNLDFQKNSNVFEFPTAVNWGRFDGTAPSQGYPGNIEIFQQGSSAMNAYFIESGIVKLLHLDRDGRELIIDLRVAGWMLGLAAILVHKPYPITAVTSSKCYLRRIPAGTIRHLLKTDAELSNYIHQMHSIEVYEHIARVAQLGSLSARQRLEHLLRRFISVLNLNQLQGEIRLQLPLKHREIAQLIAITPEHLSRVFKQMQQENVLRLKDGWLIVSDICKLLGAEHY